MNDHVASAAVSQPWLLQQLRWRMLRNSGRSMLQRSLVRPLTILLCSAVVWIAIFALSYLGFFAMVNRWAIPIDLMVGGWVFDVLFMALTVLLIFSTGIILYSSLFASAETAFLLVTPLEADQIFAYKYQGAVAFSSWAFILLASPVLIAYGLVVGGGAPWYFFALLPLFFLGFVLLPGCLGALACLILVNFLPRKRRQVLWLGGVLLLAALGWWAYQRLAPHMQGLLSDRNAVNQLFSEFSLLRSPMLPSHWISAGLQAAALGELESALYHLALIWANGLFFYVLTAWAASWLYRPGFNRMASGGTLRRRYGGDWMDRALSRLLGFLDPQTRMLIIKDFRTFRRDPAQWAQILIFCGLAVLYFSNIRHFYQQDLGGRPFQNGISILNLTATSFLMCAYTGRFIFPMLSLEGRKFWILGLLPLERDRLLWGKFAFAATGALFTTESLIIFSNIMLQMPLVITLLQALTVAVVSFGLSGLSVGLGACMPNFRESDPSKIAVGFGGTVNLIAGLLLLVLVIGAMVLPAHLLLAARGGLELGLTVKDWWLGAGVLLGTGLGAAAVIFPLRAGARALRRMEF
jgi:ABC-2 type transport system permease protein